MFWIFTQSIVHRGNTLLHIANNQSIVHKGASIQVYLVSAHTRLNFSNFHSVLMFVINFSLTKMCPLNPCFLKEIFQDWGSGKPAQDFWSHPKADIGVGQAKVVFMQRCPYQLDLQPISVLKLNPQPPSQANATCVQDFHGIIHDRRFVGAESAKWLHNGRCSVMGLGNIWRYVGGMS